MLKNTELIGNDFATVNQIRPHVRKWAWDSYLKGMRNHWNPSEVKMGEDIEQWQNPKSLTDDERLLVRRCLGFFAGSESLVANNLLLNIFRYVLDAECRQYMIRQLAEEAIHNHTLVYVCDSLGLDETELYEAYARIPSIKAKDDFLISITKDIGRGDFTIPAEKGRARTVAIQEVLRNIITYYCVCEGVFFYSGFAMLLQFGRQGKLKGISEQIQFTVRDESLHVQFGTRLVEEIKTCYPEVWTKTFQNETIEHFKKAVELEAAYAKDILPRGILGLSAPMFLDYAQYIANRRLQGIGLPAIYESPRNPFPWMAEAIDITKQKNFFETTVTEYQAGGLSGDF